MRVGGWTLILTENGWKPISRLLWDELIWDGEGFVKHGWITGPSSEWGSKSKGVFICTGLHGSPHALTVKETNVGARYKEVKYEGYGSQMDSATGYIRDCPNTFIGHTYSGCVSIYAPFFTVLTAEGPAVLPGEGFPC